MTDNERLFLDDLYIAECNYYLNDDLDMTEPFDIWVYGALQYAAGRKSVNKISEEEEQCLN